MTHELFGPVISSYSRAQAIEDGVLIDITEQARQQRFVFPMHKEVIDCYYYMQR